MCYFYTLEVVDRDSDQVGGNLNLDNLAGQGDFNRVYRQILYACHHYCVQIPTLGIENVNKIFCRIVCKLWYIVYWAPSMI